MENENQDVKQVEESPTLADAMEETAASEQQTEQEQGTPQEPEVQEEEQPVVQTEEQVPYSRFKEVIDQKNEAKAREDWYRKKLDETQPKQPDEKRGNTPEEREFWNAVREEARKVNVEQSGKTNSMLNQGLQEIAAIRVQQFRASHPDIKANSPEEHDIATRINQGYKPDDAYWSVMGPKGVQAAKVQATKKAKQTFTQKRQANMESNSVAPQLQKGPVRTFEEELADSVMKSDGGF